MLAERYPGLKLYGHDQSSYLISLARERALHSVPETPYVPVFSVGDCRSVPHESGEFDFVMIMGNSFGYFSANDIGVEGEEGDRAVLREINRLLKMGGLMVLDLADGDYMRNNFSPR
jgi:SAM-dependent methyltransferase